MKNLLLFILFLSAQNLFSQVKVDTLLINFDYGKNQVKSTKFFDKRIPSYFIFYEQMFSKIDFTPDFEKPEFIIVNQEFLTRHKKNTIKSGDLRKMSIENATAKLSSYSSNVAYVIDNEETQKGKLILWKVFIHSTAITE